MKHQDLKDKMDNIENTFDKEVLWNSINKKDEKRKPLFWLMSLFLGSLLVYISFGIPNHSTLFPKNVKPKNGVEIKNITTSIQHFQSHASTPLNSTNDENQQLHYHTNTLKLDYKIKPVLPKAKTTSEESYKSKKNESSATHIDNAFKDLFSPINNESEQAYDLIHTNEHYKSNMEQEFPLHTANKFKPISDEVGFELDTRNVNSTLGSHFAPLSKKSIYLKYPQRFSINIDLPILPSLSDKSSERFKRNVLKIYCGIGYDNHDFSNSDYGYFRKSIEKNLETKSLSLSYERVLWQKFYLKSSLIYVLSQTHLTRTDVDTTWYLNAKNKTVKSWSGNNYNLYNAYNRIDAMLEFGYGFVIGRSFKIKPSIGVGLNVLHKESGEIWDVNQNLVTLHSLSEYSYPDNRFIIYGLSIEKNLRHDFTIGLSFALQSKRTLSNINFIEHYIQPMNIQLNVGQQF